MNRRSILSLFTGAAASASVGVRPSDVVRASGVGPMPIERYPGDDYGPEQSDANAIQKLLWPHQRALDADIDTKMEFFWHSENRLPPHIASKRSWSPAFKISEAQKEYAQLKRASRMLHDQDFLLTLLKEKGIL